MAELCEHSVKLLEMKGVEILSLVLNLYLWGLEEIFVATRAVSHVEKDF